MENKIIVKIKSPDVAYHASSIEEVVVIIKNAYIQGDVCLGELMAQVYIEGISLEDAQYIITKLRCIIDGEGDISSEYIRSW